MSDLTRSDFISAYSRLGGSTYAAMRALGLLAGSTSRRFELAGGGAGKRIIILGAGLAGMTCAYELEKLGYECVLLEARARSGGRCWSVRGGDAHQEIEGETQVARFDEGLYLNPGPARIPQDHVTLDYCRELGVEVEVFTNWNYSAYLHDPGVAEGSPAVARFREAAFDLRGYVDELLTKAIDRGVLEDELTAEDRDRIREFLASDGSLQTGSGSAVYRGTARRGYLVPPGAGPQPGEESRPFRLQELLRSKLGLKFEFLTEYDQQMTMFQIRGGTDQLARRLHDRLHSPVNLEAKVARIISHDDRVDVLYRDGSGMQDRLEGDYCICTIPLPVLKEIETSFSPEMRAAIAAVQYEATVKLGLQMKRRFWETDEQLFGGVTLTGSPITQIWYPSYGYLARKGVLLGAYTFSETAQALGKLSPEKRVEEALAQGALIHSQYRDEFEDGFSVAWHRTPYSLGGWSSYTDDTRKDHYDRLNTPDGRIYLCGEHLTYLNGWMAGAFESARLVSSQLHERALRDSPP